MSVSSEAYGISECSNGDSLTVDSIVDSFMFMVDSIVASFMVDSFVCFISGT